MTDTAKLQHWSPKDLKGNKWILFFLLYDYFWSALEVIVAVAVKVEASINLISSSSHASSFSLNDAWYRSHSRL